MSGFNTLREMRLSGRMSMTELAERMNVQRTAIVHMELHAKQIVPRSVLKYARALGVDPFEMIKEMAEEAMQREIYDEELECTNDKAKAKT